MDAFSLDVDVDLTGASHHFTRSGGDDACRQLRPQMHAIDVSDMEAFQKAALTQQSGTPGILFPRLKDQQDVVRKGRKDLRQSKRKPQQHCHMAVMSAGVHLAGVLTVVGHSGLLLDGQGIHIAAKSDRGKLFRCQNTPARCFRWAKTAYRATTAGVGSGILCFGQVQFQLRDLVQVPAKALDRRKHHIPPLCLF